MPRERLKHAVTHGLFVRAIYSDLGRALTLAGASACLLLPLLSQPLWRDEGSTFIDVSQPNVAGVLDSIRVNELTPPLYFLLEHLWINFAGTTEFALRFPSLVAIALAIGLLYDTARRVRDRVAGYATAGCAGLAPLSLLVGSEARAYALTLLLGALVMWLVARLFLTPLADVHAGAAGLALATAAICWVNYTAWPAVAALLIIAPAICMAESSRRALLLFVALAAGAAATLPIIPTLQSSTENILHVPFDPNAGRILQGIGSRFVWFNPLPIPGSATALALVAATIAWVIASRPFLRKLTLTAEDRFLIVCLGLLIVGVAVSIRPSFQGYHLACYAPSLWLIFGTYYSRFTTSLHLRDGLSTLSPSRTLGFLALAATTILTVATFPLLYTYQLVC